MTSLLFQYVCVRIVISSVHIIISCLWIMVLIWKMFHKLNWVQNISQSNMFYFDWNDLLYTLTAPIKILHINCHIIIDTDLLFSTIILHA